MGSTPFRDQDDQTAQQSRVTEQSHREQQSMRDESMDGEEIIPEEIVQRKLATHEKSEFK